MIKLKNHQNEVNSLFLDQDPTLPFGTWDFQQVANTDQGFNLGLPGLFEFEPWMVYPQMMSIISKVDHQLNDFEDIAGDLRLWDFDQQSIPNAANTNPLTDVHEYVNCVTDDQDEDSHARMCNSNGLVPTHYSHLSSRNKNTNCNVSRNGRGRKSSALRLEDIQKFFDVPITQAAKELNVGLTVLKKRCRELNITRWPHRKIKSLESLIHNVKELGISNEIEMLEEHKRQVEKIPQMELTERAKKLRQACFKANYKKRRSVSYSSSSSLLQMIND